MATFDIPIGPSISERGTTCLMSGAKPAKVRCPVRKPVYGSITYDREKGNMPLEWPNEDGFRIWLAAEEQDKVIHLILSHTEASDSPNWRARRMFRCSREFSGGKPHREKKHQHDRKIPSMKTGCRCKLIVKQYPGTEIILGKYEGAHDHPLGDDNLRFLRLSNKVRNLVKGMILTGMGSQAMVSSRLILRLPSELTERRLQLERVQQSCKRTDRDYHITMRDINRLRRIVEEGEIRLDDNDAISVRLWVTQLRQGGVEAVLKDKMDPPPPGSGISGDCFVLCIQTVFQRDRFRSLGSDFLSIDATHNTTQYYGVQLFTLVVRDLWGHGTLCGVFPFTDAYSLHRCACCLDAVVNYYGSDNYLFSKICKRSQPGDHTADHHE